MRTILFSYLIVFPLLLFAEAFCLARFFANLTVTIKEADWRELQRKEITLTIVSFHSYYRTWPCPPGPLNENALDELGGFTTAVVNTKHIDFFKENNCTMLLQDAKGHPLLFQPDDVIGTCVVFIDPKYGE